jgi:drug/metabolite transporter (DMT)-like permease
MGKRVFMSYILLSVCLNAFAQIAMKMASQKPLSLRELMNNGALLIAGFLYVVSIFLWLKGLSGMNLSKAYPYQSLGYLLVFGVSVGFLHEKISTIQVLGLFIICLGILVLGFAK